MSGPLFSFGVIADIQYADLSNGASYGGTPRYYRHSLKALQRAVDDWKLQQQEAAAPSSRPLSFCLNLGDIVDGHALPNSEDALRDVLGELSRLEGVPVHHVIGNHCLYNFPRPELNARLGIRCNDAASPGGSHYSVQPHPGWRVVVLDGYDVSMLGWAHTRRAGSHSHIRQRVCKEWRQGEGSHPHHKLGKQLLHKHNPNEEKNKPPSWGVDRRWVKFGGGVGALQLDWLRAQLQDAQRLGERVIVVCHLPLHPKSAFGACLLWNYQEVLDLLNNCSNVVATLAGHAHEDGYACEEGLHHRVLNCVVETPPGEVCHGVVHVHQDRLEVEGRGALLSQQMRLRPLCQDGAGRDKAAAKVHQAQQRRQQAAQGPHQLAVAAQVVSQGAANPTEAQGKVNVSVTHMDVETVDAME